MKLEKGHNSTRIGIRLSNEDIVYLQGVAKEREMTFNAYISDRLHNLVERIRSVPAANPTNPTLVEFRSVPTSIRSVPATKRLAKAREVLKQVEGRIKESYNPAKHGLTMQLPIYDPIVHKAGDKVRVWKFGTWRAVTVPELDGDGNPVW